MLLKEVGKEVRKGCGWRVYSAVMVDTPLVSVQFTRNLARHVSCPAAKYVGTTVAEVLGAYFADHPAVRHYVLDDQGGVRQHVTVFVGGSTITDRIRLTDAVGAGDEIYVMQALSGGM